MSSYVIKYADQHGEWFLERAGMWSDTYRDATHYETQEEAEKIAEDTRARLVKHEAGVPGTIGYPRVKVIKMRGLQ